MRPQADPDFVRYVRAREERLLVGARLVCGDRRRAQRLVEATLADAAGQWHRLRQDDPDAFVRPRLYRAAAARPRGDVDTSPPSGELGPLTPRQRGALVLRFHEGRSEAESAEVLGISPAAVREQVRSATRELAGRGLATDEDLADLVRAVAEREGLNEDDRHADDAGHADGVSHAELAERAWGMARGRQTARRRRLRGLAALAAAAAVVTAVVQYTGVPSPTPAPTPSQVTTGAAHRLADGTIYAQLPKEGEEGQLAEFDLGLPSVIDTGGAVTRLSQLARPPEAVAAVYVRPEGTTYRPVLVTSTGEQVVADRARLVPVQDPEGGAGIPLGPRAVGAGGRFAVFPQPGAVVRVDLRSGAVVTYPVPAQDLVSAGWTGDQNLVVARSRDRAWTIEAQRPGAQAQAVAPTAYEGLFRLGSDSRLPDRLVLAEHGGDAVRRSTRSLPAPVSQIWGDTLGTQDWAVAGAFFDQNLTHPVIRRGNGPIYQGLAAVDVPHGTTRVLLAPESPDGQTGRVKGCCPPLGWADGQTVVLRAYGRHGSWVLTWNVQTGEVLRVAQVNEPLDGVPTVFALAVGWRF